MPVPPAPAPDGPVPRLEVQGITKGFPGCLANDRVDLTLMPGEIHALLGENGAGKSTLVKIIYGVLAADSGVIRWQGEPVTVGDPAAARRLGIGMVFQHFSLFESLTTAENITLGLERPEPPAGLARRIVEVSARYGLGVDPGRHVHALSVGERQRVEIVRCLLQEPRLLIMDEPTSVLTPQETKALFDTLRTLAAEGVTILYISHKLEEIRALCGRATVLRGGRVVAECDPRRESARTLAELMIGGDLRIPQRDDSRAGDAPADDAHADDARADDGHAGGPRLQVRHLSTTSDDPFATTLKDVTFDVRAGEILGIAGVAGNGQSELLAALSGETRTADPGTVRIDGVPAGDRGPRGRRELGLAVVPEERLGRGAVPEMNLAENAVLGGERQGLVRSGLLDRARARQLADHIIGTFGVVAAGHQAEARSLSGGNLQKFIIGREILLEPRLLVAAAPTWGVDAGAAAAIHQALLDLARAGTAIVVISQDLDELFVLCDRIAVMFHGRLSGTRPIGQTSVERMGLLMCGLFEDGAGDEVLDVA
ncbi:MAG TPA: ABC transporter ATP-binding protein [Arenibaculum sp.]|nr:ABC transporter ATP-binding protein [Arenibaculum sp.]